MIVFTHTQASAVRAGEVVMLDDGLFRVTAVKSPEFSGDGFVWMELVAPVTGPVTHQFTVEFDPRDVVMIREER